MVTFGIIFYVHNLLMRKDQLSSVHSNGHFRNNFSTSTTLLCEKINCPQFPQMVTFGRIFSTSTTFLCGKTANSRILPLYRIMTWSVIKSHRTRSVSITLTEIEILVSTPQGYATVPRDDALEYGYRMGGPEHMVERHHKTRGDHSTIKLNWEDKNGDSGDQYWEFNHEDEKPKQRNRKRKVRNNHKKKRKTKTMILTTTTNR
ncbi:uncharacterized protein CEXT_623611 [Caerostris extrusa]|uniref:Uncharacterized protein n=1 Tax=Caerostris extrusa TaxID=172846 RepID=A0AAV4PMI9_CAEEX|nr:uncharacterized protein CEXT_623611 [Caerostris extrusa]